MQRVCRCSKFVNNSSVCIAICTAMRCSILNKIETSQIRRFAVSQFRSFAVLQFRSFAVSQFRSFAVSQVYLEIHSPKNVIFKRRHSLIATGVEIVEAVLSSFYSIMSAPWAIGDVVCSLQRIGIVL